jgi:hypothetical protein
MEVSVKREDIVRLLYLLQLGRAGDRTSRGLDRTHKKIYSDRRSEADKDHESPGDSNGACEFAMGIHSVPFLVYGTGEHAANVPEGAVL